MNEVTLRIAIEDGDYEAESTRTFQNAETALAWLNGYLSAGDITVTHFRATFADR